MSWIEQELCEYLDRWRVYPPLPGRAVLACRCGKSLDLADMHVRGAGHYGNDDPKLGAITCAECAHTS